MAKAAAKKKAHGASRNPPASAPGKGAPGWVWLLAGFITACFIFFLIHLKQSGGGIGKILPELAGGKTAAPANSAPPAAATGDDNDSDTAASGKEAPRFDFYSLLPNQKMVPNKDAEDAATKAAAAAAALAQKKQAAIQAAELAAASGQAGTPPGDQTPMSPPVSEPTPAVTPEPAPVATPAPAVAEEPPAPVAKPKPAPKPSAKASYFLQAGSFKSESEADRRRASIILLGLPVKTEMVTKDAQNWYRVIVGPMDSKDNLDSARSTLQGSGIQTAPAKKG